MRCLERPTTLALDDERNNPVSPLLFPPLPLLLPLPPPLVAAEERDKADRRGDKEEEEDVSRLLLRLEEFFLRLRAVFGDAVVLSLFNVEGFVVVSVSNVKSVIVDDVVSADTDRPCNDTGACFDVVLLVP